MSVHRYRNNDKNNLINVYISVWYCMSTLAKWCRYSIPKFTFRSNVEMKKNEVFSIPSFILFFEEKDNIKGQSNEIFDLQFFS